MLELLDITSIQQTKQTFTWRIINRLPTSTPLTKYREIKTGEVASRSILPELKKIFVTCEAVKIV